MTVSDFDGLRPVADARVWRGAEQAGRTDWIVALDAVECAELERAAERVRARGVTLGDATRADFELPVLARKLAAIEHTLAVGRGFVMLRGLPHERYSDDELGIIYWGIGTHLGVGVSQSADGDRLGHVVDRGWTDERYYTRGGALEFHMDPVDVVGLLCLRRARSGGASRIASALAVHNVILAERPDLLALLYRGFVNSKRAHREPTTGARVPVFAHGGPGVECYLLPITIRQAIEEGYPLTDAEREALDYVGDVADRPDIRLDMDFREGDIQFLNNRTILHARTDYIDDPDPTKKRHLLRLWLMMPDWPKRAAAQRFHQLVDRTGGGVKPRQAVG